MAYFPHAYQKALVANSLATPGTASSALTAGQLALISATSNLSVALSTTSPDYAVTPLAYLAQGSFHTTDKLGPFHGGYQESVKSKGINPKYISSFTVSEPSNPVQDIFQIPVAVGCKVTCDTTYRLRLDLKGSPALRFLTHNAYFTLDAHTGCCDEAKNNVDPNIVLLGWADRLALYPTVKDFVQAKVWNRVLNAGVAATSTAAGTAGIITVTDRTNIVAGDRVIFTPTTASSATGSTINGNLFTVGTAAATGFSVGQVLTGTGVAAGTTIVSLVTGGGGTGSTFTVNIAQTVASTTITSASPLTAYVSTAHVPATGAGTVQLVAASVLQTPSTTNLGTITTTAGTVTKVYDVISSTTYVPLAGATAPDTVDSFLEIVGAYVDTTFGNCSFSPIDHVEYQPIEIYASVTAMDPLGNQCLAQCFDPPAATKTYEVQQAVQGRGFGETLIRELILSKRYEQEPWQQDPRLREVLDYNPFGEVIRANKYLIYNLLHSVPRKSNPSGTMDNDQYLIRIFVPSTTGRLTALEQGITKWLQTANNYDCTFKVLP
jgi:hypothetical protein